MGADAETGSRGSRPLRTVMASTVSLTAASLPVWLVGALSVFMAEDFRFTEVQLGYVVAIYFGVAAVGAWTAGRVTERIGSRLAIMVASGVSAIALLGLGFIADSWIQVAFFAAVAGLGSALAMPATNLALVRGMPLNRMGISFGVKQAAVPFSTFLAGISVPLLALTVGWRYAFFVALAFAVSVGGMSGYWLMPDRPSPQRDRSTDQAPQVPSSAIPRSLGLMAVAACFAVLGATAANAFLVPTLVSRGIQPAVAGVLLSVGGMTSMLMRVGMGAYTDVRMGDSLRRLAGLYLAGSLGAALMIFSGTRLPVIVIGVALVYGAGWGWNGLFHYALVRTYAARPAFATGVAQIGIRLGGVVGPLMFGVVMAYAHERIAWGIVATSLAAAGITVSAAGRRITYEGLMQQGTT